MSSCPGRRIYIKNRASFSAFTLVEILLVVSLVTMISLTLYNAFSNGLKLWSRSQHLSVEEDIAIFFEKINEELDNSYAFSKFYFKGRTNSFAFPSRVNVWQKSQGKDAAIKEPGMIEYFFDPLSDDLYKRESNYGVAIERKFSGEDRLIFSKIKSVGFKYFLRDSEGRLFSTQITDEMPRGVRIDVTFLDGQGQEKNLSKLIFMPMAQQL
ncbi:MAG: hypothetical protein A2Z88_07210 [Omnitrophica WOR_2 bacterium GWA2_47_8]|nr:MAG: hypothetical protein A2Z88_07210 [Omnitrophica WOR_2 bacterium GWA2_47_8]